MSPVRRRVLLLAAVVGLMLTVLPSGPAAQAAVAPWTWKRATQQVAVAATTSYTVTASCPAGYSAITGGLQLPAMSGLVPMGEYRQTNGSGWTVLFRNQSTSTGTATVVAECVLATDLPPMSYDIQVFNRDANGYASGEIGCPNPGDVVLTGGVDWSNGSPDKRMTASTPGFGETSWYGAGYNPVSGATMAVEVYCVNPAYVPGYQMVTLLRTGSGWHSESLACPQGKRILNGGNLDYVNGSAPNLTTWNAVFLHYNSTQTTQLRAICINAGSPTISLDGFSPGGPISGSSYAAFLFSGADPAGYPNGFKCSLNGSAPTSCGGSQSYFDLTSGDYEFVAWNTTPDGRSSGPVTHQWTVDRDPPTITTPKVRQVTLASSAKVKWSGTDAVAGIGHYSAIYNLVHTDGTSTGWTQPTNWVTLANPRVKTPALAEGESVCVSVQAQDTVGNTSSWSAQACTTRPFDDRSLTASAGWSRVTGNAYWLKTATSTTASGESLSRSAVNLNRVGVVATVCPGCGVAVVKVGGIKIGRINLNATALRNKRVLLLPGFGEQAGVVTVKSVTSGKQITIDGLVAMQTVHAAPAI